MSHLDFGKQSYKNSHKLYKDQQTRHILSKDLLSSYGVS